MKTIANIIHNTKFPLSVKDSNSNVIYYEYSDREWWKQAVDSEGIQIYYEHSDGYIVDNRG